MSLRSSAFEVLRSQDRRHESVNDVVSIGIIYTNFLILDFRFLVELKAATMLESPAVHYAILGITCIVYIIHIILSSVAGGGGNSAFPSSQKEMSEQFQLSITPAGATFSIWAVIFAYQVIWMIYAVGSTIRHGMSTEIQSKETLLNFLCYTIAVVVWLFVWARQNIVGGLICLVVASFFINIAFGYACADLHSFVATYGKPLDSIIDIRCHRYLIQNGIIFNATWVVIATLLNVAIVLKYELNVTDTTASLVALTFLGLAIITWFAVENWALEEYTEYTFTNYIVVVVALIGILLNGRTAGNKELYWLTVALLVIACVMFLLRVIFLFRKCCGKDNEHGQSESQSVRMRSMKKSYTY